MLSEDFLVAQDGGLAGCIVYARRTRRKDAPFLALVALFSGIELESRVDERVVLVGSHHQRVDAGVVEVGGAGAEDR